MAGQVVRDGSCSCFYIPTTPRITEPVTLGGQGETIGRDNDYCKFTWHPREGVSP